jgi:cytochrome c-type biogenesis protein CcmF
MVQERRGMLRVWNVSLICATFVLSLLGTFLVRSGVLQSIHAFGESKVGVPLLVLIGIITIGSTALIASRREDLQSERRLDSLLSREAIFLVNNILLVGLAAIILFGTFFPLISDLVGDKASIGPPWFNQYATPLAIGLVFFMGIGPLVAWRRVTLAGIWRAVGLPLAATLVGAVVLAATIGIADSPTAYALFLGGIFTVAAIAQEIVRGVGARRSLAGGSIPGALGTLLTRNRRRYGGYIVHVGLVLSLFGIAASSSFQTSRDLRLSPGQSAEVGDYTVTYERPTGYVDAKENKLVLGSVLSVTRDGEQVTTLSPARAYYGGSGTDPAAPIQGFFEGEATSEVGRDESLSKDLWSAMQPDLTRYDALIAKADRLYAKKFGPAIDNPDPDVQAALADVQGRAISALAQRYLQKTPPADIRFNVNPFVIWFWLGVIVGVGGALFALWPTAEGRRRRVSDVYGARLARDLTRI